MQEHDEGQCEAKRPQAEMEMAMAKAMPPPPTDRFNMMIGCRAVDGGVIVEMKGSIPGSRKVTDKIKVCAGKEGSDRLHNLVQRSVLALVREHFEVVADPRQPGE
jgi:hypothetical protein